MTEHTRPIFPSLINPERWFIDFIMTSLGSTLGGKANLIFRGNIHKSFKDDLWPNSISWVFPQICPCLPTKGQIWNEKNKRGSEGTLRAPVMVFSFWHSKHSLRFSRNILFELDCILWVKAGFLNVNIIDMLDQITLCGGGRGVLDLEGCLVVSLVFVH